MFRSQTKSKVEVIIPRTKNQSHKYMKKWLGGNSQAVKNSHHNSKHTTTSSPMKSQAMLWSKVEIFFFFIGVVVGLDQ